MCGIAGYFDSPRPGSHDLMERLVRKMSDSMHHRGPDDEGAWVDDAAGIALGQRRLSILDLSPLGHQPMHSACGRYVITFNGEIYNHRDLRRRLESDGARFRGTSDTEVMLAAIAAWGLDAAVREFNGMFAFALWDRLERRLSLARDRAGEKPLYYARFGQTLLFGSELKALRAHPRFQGEIDRDALALFLRHSYIPAPYSIYQGVKKLPPGTTLTIAACSGRLPQPEPYWSFQGAAQQGTANPFTGSDEEAVSELDALIRDSVKLRMEADVPLGAFLSGGIDSSTTVAAMQAQSSRPVRTFTIGFNEAGYNEAEQAKLVARHLGTEHTELYVTPTEAMAVIPTLASIYDEPFGDSSQIPTILVSQLARRHVTVSLSGDAGDELFGGYTRYSWGNNIWRKTGWMPTSLKGAAARMLTALPVAGWEALFRCADPLMPARFRQRNPGHKLHKLAEVLTAGSSREMYMGLVSQWKHPERLVLGAHEPLTALSSEGEWNRLPDLAHQMMYLDSVTYLPDDILVKTDRASMSVSLEARVPLLDHRLIEMAWRLPLHMKIRNGQGKWLLRQVLNKYVPKKLTDRPKMGFAIPIDGWLRGALRPWAEDLLAERRLRSEGYFDPREIRQKWQEHLSGVRNWQYYLWNILMFQSWQEEAAAGISCRASRRSA
ncbi:MAG: asparagine synthase (glutamine-hydrolyzing) [Bryobacteraceae bacterium]